MMDFLILFKALIFQYKHVVIFLFVRVNEIDIELMKAFVLSV